MKSLIRMCLFCMPFLAAVFLVVELVVSNQLAALGGRLGSLDGKILEARQTQETLVAQVARATSLASILTHANTLGFHEPSRQQILTLVGSQLPVAFQPNEP